MAGEVVKGGCRVNDEDRPVHAGCNDLPCELEPFLPGSSKEEDVKPVVLDPAKIQCNGRCPAGTVGFNMRGSGIKGPDQRGLSRTKGSENNNLQFFFLCHQGEDWTGSQFIVAVGKKKQERGMDLPGKVIVGLGHLFLESLALADTDNNFLDKVVWDELEAGELSVPHRATFGS